MTIFMLRFVVFHFEESPKFLLSRGHDEKAVAVLHKIARFNKRESTINLDVLAALADHDISTRRSGIDSPILAADTKQIESSFGQKAKTELVRYKLLFATSTMARLTILIWIAYVFDYWGFSIAGAAYFEESQIFYC